ncbi:DUF1349 domain-containing protein [Leuconostoc suionicum]|uniref:DUF1349 domain-containing protein n=1 Tax=Leuconostoc suionicum TaxID=1511761 RepID=UPI0024AD3116|nr:DUF1349 domain-containing protein [Leuconostoc suionicum]MDI6496939.1 DUF1349 domain-containing protein [Leuconostoc suionicum]MDI6499066.1 DUF1349 domain-containing protein [Leuconostoc suionicum]MDI6501448.1 DUF1349 domain-containing protein [Leuconostoc suionicum]MDI6614187.1 DUF1349 domain-containing protein [Leuconostoc suionicum]MDI6664064.1 DUF1349 domain-containing protein [Leuconostoc suionicum]
MLKNFTWVNEPKKFTISSNNQLELVTENGTDLWQRTHYGFSVTNAPMFMESVTSKNFTFSVKTAFQSNFLYDQCGIIVYIDNDNWAKFSSEFENTSFQRLGGVVTKSGYSDWATTDISSKINEIYYRINRQENDFIVEASYDGENYFQLRIFNLNYDEPITKISIGVYGCSPQGDGFKSTFTNFVLSENNN